MLAHKTLPRKEKFHCTESFIVHKTYIFIAWIMNFGRRERGDGEERGHKDWKDIALQFVAVNIYWDVMLVSLKRRREHNTKKQPWNERGKCCFCQSSAESSTDPCKSLIVYENPSTSSSIFTRIFRHGICSFTPSDSHFSERVFVLLPMRANIHRWANSTPAAAAGLLAWQKKKQAAAKESASRCLTFLFNSH